MRRRNALLVSWLLIAVLTGLVACGDDDDDVTGPSSAPDSHTVSQDGVRHLTGLQDPQNNCTGCHGPDLRGGDGGEPSCYSCHGQKW